MLGSEYGWAKQDILQHVYIDEVFEYQRLITKRKKDQYLMLLNIVHNPYRDKKDMNRLFDDLSKSVDEPDKPKVLDKQSFDLVRSAILGSPGSKFVVK